MAATDCMVTFQGEGLSDQFLSEDDIKQMCSFAFCETPTNEKVSDKYVMMTSMDVVRDLAKLGWYPVRAAQRKAQKNRSGASRFSFHQIWFQNPNVYITRDTGDGEVVDCYPRVILINSADGCNSLRFGVGLYRVICSNGLVCSSQNLAEFSVRHIHYSFEYVKELIQRVMMELPNQVAEMNRMREITLSESQRMDFAKRVWSLRTNVPVEEIKEDDETFLDMLDPVREEDKGTSLWDTYNVLQEKVVKGGFFSAKKEDTKKPRKVRQIKSFVAETELSRKVDELARQYLEIAA